MLYEYDMLTSSGMRSVLIYKCMYIFFSRYNDIKFATQTTYISSTKQVLVRNTKRPGLKKKINSDIKFLFCLLAENSSCPC
jgi:hypothetical protein